MIKPEVRLTWLHCYYPAGGRKATVVLCYAIAVSWPLLGRWDDSLEVKFPSSAETLRVLSTGRLCCLISPGEREWTLSCHVHRGTSQAICHGKHVCESVCLGEGMTEKWSHLNSCSDPLLAQKYLAIDAIVLQTGTTKFCLTGTWYSACCHFGYFPVILYYLQLVYIFLHNKA